MTVIVIAYVVTGLFVVLGAALFGASVFAERESIRRERRLRDYPPIEVEDLDAMLQRLSDDLDE